MTVYDDRPFFHEGMRSFQDMFDGRRTAEAIEKHRKHYAFWEDETALINQSRFFVIATAYQDYVDCSIKSGDPGFVRITEPNVLEYPEYDGNSMYRTVGNIAKNPNVAILFVAFDGKSRRIRINGKAKVLIDQKALDRHFGAKLVIRIECEIYPNCPRYLPNLTDSENSPYVPRHGHGTPPAPEWKSRAYIRSTLPHDDPHAKRADGDDGLD